MTDFDLDLGSIEQEMDDDDGRRVVLGLLDGETPGESWIEEVERGNVLVLHIVGELDDLASEFAGAVTERGGSLMRFRNVLIVVPAGVDIDRRRLH